jgi:orotidine 5'-phosphate decarboxylase subfamily 2
MIEHNFVQLAEVQRKQGTLFCAGLDPHLFGSREKNLEIYPLVESEACGFYGKYLQLVGKIKDPDQREFYARFLAGVEHHITERVVRTCVERAGLFNFKPQYGFYQQFGPEGILMLQRVRDYIKALEIKNGIRIICGLDCKRGDIDTTQAAYFTGLIGNLAGELGIDYAPFDFCYMNVAPWMGRDVYVLVDEENKPKLGLNLMRQGKGLIGVNKTSNPSGPDYQELSLLGCDTTLQMRHVADSCAWSREFGLESRGLSSIGLVVGSTHPCDGSIRKAFPAATLLVPGFGHQKGNFPLIMLELIRQGEWIGQGAIFSASRSNMYAHFKKYEGSGLLAKLEDDLVQAVRQFRKNEKEAFRAREVMEAGIRYPF